MEKTSGTALTHLCILKARQTQELVRGYRQFRRKKNMYRGSACWWEGRAVARVSRAAALPIGLKRALVAARESCIRGEIKWRKPRPRFSLSPLLRMALQEQYK